MPQPEPRRPDAVVDDKLGDHDVRLRVSMTLRSRAKQIMVECEFDTVIHEALHDEARGRFLEHVERVFEEAKQATSAY